MMDAGRRHRHEGVLQLPEVEGRRVDHPRKHTQGELGTPVKLGLTVWDKFDGRPFPVFYLYTAASKDAENFVFVKFLKTTAGSSGPAGAYFAFDAVLSGGDPTDTHMNVYIATASDASTFALPV